MPISPTAVWEVRTTGSDANGGAFRAGATGIDYSQQNTPQVIFSDLVIGTNTTELTSAANPFTAAHVGNVINVTASTGFAAGRYEIMSVSAGVATMDRPVASVVNTPATGGSGRLGGCLLTLPALTSAMAASNRAFVRAGNYPITATALFVASHTPSAAAPPTTVSGYYQTRGDLYPGSPDNANRPTLTVNAAIASVISGVTSSGLLIQNLQLVAGSSNSSSFIILGTNSAVVNVRMSGFSGRGISAAGSGGRVQHCEFVNGTAASGSAAIHGTNTNLTVFNSHVRNCSGGGMFFGGVGAVVDACVVVNNPGANTDGISFAGGGILTRSLIHGNGRDGVRHTGMANGASLTLGNIFSENGGYGLNSTGAFPAQPMYDGNAYYLNALGARNNVDDTTAVATNGVGAYTNVRDVVLTASPFTDKTAGDWSLNNTPGGGAALRGTATPSSWPGLAVTGYPDFGPIQQQRSSSEIIIPYLGF